MGKDILLQPHAKINFSPLVVFFFFPCGLYPGSADLRIEFFFIFRQGFIKLHRLVLNLWSPLNNKFPNFLATFSMALGMEAKASDITKHML